MQSSYDYPMIVSLTPKELCPQPLPDDCAWAIVLLELPTADDMPQRAFFGERVLVERLAEGTASWSGHLASQSQLAPTLRVGEIVGGRPFNRHRVCEGVVRDNRVTALTLDPPSSGLDVATFLVPKAGATHMLQCASVECANPSCAHYFSLTHSQFTEQLNAVAATVPQYGNGASGYLIAKCELCQTSKVIDEKAFATLFKI